MSDSDETVCDENETDENDMEESNSPSILSSWYPATVVEKKAETSAKKPEKNVTLEDSRKNIIETEVNDCSQGSGSPEFPLIFRELKRKDHSDESNQKENTKMLRKEVVEIVDSAEEKRETRDCPTNMTDTCLDSKNDNDDGGAKIEALLANIEMVTTGLEANQDSDPNTSPLNHSLVENVKSQLSILQKSLVEANNKNQVERKKLLLSDSQEDCQQLSEEKRQVILRLAKKQRNVLEVFKQYKDLVKRLKALKNHEENVLNEKTSTTIATTKTGTNIATTKNGTDIATTKTSTTTATSKTSTTTAASKTNSTTAITTTSTTTATTETNTTTATTKTSSIPATTKTNTTIATPKTSTTTDTNKTNTATTKTSTTAAITKTNSTTANTKTSTTIHQSNTSTETALGSTIVASTTNMATSRFTQNLSHQSTQKQSLTPISSEALRQINILATKGPFQMPSYKSASGRVMIVTGTGVTMPEITTSRANTTVTIQSTNTNSLSSQLPGVSPTTNVMKKRNVTTPVTLATQDATLAQSQKTLCGPSFTLGGTRPSITYSRATICEANTDNRSCTRFVPQPTTVIPTTPGVHNPSQSKEQTVAHCATTKQYCNTGNSLGNSQCSQSSSLVGQSTTKQIPGVTLEALVKKGILRSGTNVLTATSEGKQYSASLSQRGMIISAGGEGFTSPRSWVKAILGSKRKVKNEVAWKMVAYKDKPLLEYANATMIEQQQQQQQQQQPVVYNSSSVSKNIDSVPTAYNGQKNQRTSLITSGEALNCLLKNCRVVGIAKEELVSSEGMFTKDFWEKKEFELESLSNDILSGLEF